jgi:hypothetical protein
MRSFRLECSEDEKMERAAGWIKNENCVNREDDADLSGNLL